MFRAKVEVANKDQILTTVANHIKESILHLTANGNPLKDFKWGDGTT